MAQQAQDTFIAVLDDGTERLVTKGEVFADGHELVKRDLKGSGMLFRKLDLGEAEAVPTPAPAKVTAKTKAAS
jgi:hypothetical protein